MERYEEYKIIDRLEKWKNGERTSPLKIEIKVTFRCNLKCLMCGSGYHSPEQTDQLKKEELSDRRFRDIVKEAGECGVKEVLLMGGEAMLRPELTFEMMRAVKKYNMAGTFFTNCTLFNQTHIKELVLMGWDSLVISLDGPTADINDLIRGNGTFDLIRNTIKEINCLKNKMGEDKPALTLYCLLWKKNYKKISEMVELTKRLNCDKITIARLQEYTPTAKGYDLNACEYREALCHIRNAKYLADRIHLNTNLNEFLTESMKENYNGHFIQKKMPKEKSNLPPPGSIHCMIPWYSLYISPEGKVDLCGKFRGLEWKNKNRSNYFWLESESLNEIWNSPCFNEIRDNIINGMIPEPCLECKQQMR